MTFVLAAALRETVRRRGRSTFVVASYAIATASIIVIFALIIHANNATGRILASTGTHFIAFAPASKAGDCDCAQRLIDPEHEGFIASGGGPSLPVSIDLSLKANAIPSVSGASPYLLFRLKDDKLGSFTLGGFDVADNKAVGTTCCAPSDIISGVFLSPGDGGKVMLEEAFAKSVKLGAGDKIVLGNREFTVCGIINPGIRPAKADIYMPFREATPVINTRLKRPLINEMNILLVEALNANVQIAAMKAVKNIMPGSVISSYACYKPAAAVMDMNMRSAWLVVVIIIFVAILVAMRAQSAAVIERRRDIAILKSIGWTNGNVLMLILSEMVIQATTGGILGILAASLFLMALPPAILSGAQSSNAISVPADLIALSLCFSILGGVIAGIIPAMSAARMFPAEAFRQA